MASSVNCDCRLNLALVILPAIHVLMFVGRHAAGLNFGDCFAYALAKLYAEPLLAKGGDFGRTDIELCTNST